MLEPISNIIRSLLKKDAVAESTGQSKQQFEDILEKWLKSLDRVKEETDKVIRRTEQSKLPEMVDQIVKKAEQAFEKGDDYYGASYISQTLDPKLWEKFTKGYDTMTYWQMSDVLEDMEKWAQKSLKDLDDHIKGKK